MELSSLNYLTEIWGVGGVGLVSQTLSYSMSRNKFLQSFCRACMPWEILGKTKDS